MMLTFCSLVLIQFFNFCSDRHSVLVTPFAGIG
jgi:hypothetical protein